MKKFLVAAVAREPIFVKELLEDAPPVAVSLPLAVRRIVRSQLFQGRALRHWLRDFEAGDRRRMMEQVRIGLMQSGSLQRIARWIFGTQRLRDTDGIRQVTRNGADVLAPTSTNAILNRTRVAVLTSTLDARTALVCAQNNGRRIPVGQG